MNIWCSTLAGVFITLSCFTFSVVAAAPIKIGIAPNGHDSVTLAKTWIPFLEKLEQDSGLTIRFATAPDLLEFSQRVQAGDYDLIVTNRYLYTILGQKHGLNYLAELSDSAEHRKLALVAAKNVDNVQQLSGALFAIKQGEDRLNLQSLDDFLTAENVTAKRDSLPSYDKILESVSEDLHLAGLVPVSAIKSFDDKLKVLWQTENKNLYLLSATISIDNNQLQKLVNSLGNIDSSDQNSEKHEQSVISVLSVTPLPNDKSDASGAGN